MQAKYDKISDDMDTLRQENDELKASSADGRENDIDNTMKAVAQIIDKGAEYGMIGQSAAQFYITLEATTTEQFKAIWDNILVAMPLCVAAEDLYGITDYYFKIFDPTGIPIIEFQVKPSATEQVSFVCNPDYTNIINEFVAMITEN